MSIEAMKSELIEAGYEFLPEHWEGMSFDEFTGWVKAPNGDWIEGESFSYRKQHEADITRNQANNSCIQKAYAHLTKERQFAAQSQEIAALQARVSELEGVAQAYRDDIKTMIDGASSGWTVDRLRRYAIEVMQGIVKREGE
jgi:uncharacterized protein YukE